MYNNLLKDSYVVGQISNNQRIFGIANYIYNNNRFVNIYSNITYNESSIKTLGYSSSNHYENVYSLVEDEVSIVAELDEIQRIMSALWDHNVWDFNNLDGSGNPLLRR